MKVARLPDVVADRRLGGDVELNFQESPDVSFTDIVTSTMSDFGHLSDIVFASWPVAASTASCGSWPPCYSA